MSNSRIVWITGASSGIGEALALHWSSPGTLLILSGRSVPQLEKVAESCKRKEADVLLVPFDLTSSEEILKAAEKVMSAVPRIDVLVNNGGIGQRSLIIQTPPEVSRRIMETDFWGHIELTQAVLPFMVKNGGGSIAIISSLSGLFGFPQRAFYCAAKHALHGFFETLRLEHHKDNISVTMVCPGRVKTNISYHALTSSGREHGLMDKGQENGVSAAYCAARIDQALKSRRRQVIIGKKEVIMPFLKRFFPWLFYRIALKIDPNA